MTTFPLTTTLQRVHANCMPVPCRLDDALRKLENSPTHDTPIFYAQILDTLGLDYALICCRAEPQHSRLWRLYAVWCARRVQHLMTDPRSAAALNVAERHANELATDIELDAARDAARVAGLVAANVAARVAASVAAEAVTWDAAWAVTWAAAWDAAWDAAWTAAWDAERQAQADAFRQLVTTGTLP